MSVKRFFRKLFSPLLWGNLLAMVLVCVLLFVVLVWWLNSYTHHGEGIEVPDFCGVSYSKASEKGEELGLVVLANDSSYDKKLPAGCVVSQKPEAGAKVKEGRIVYVKINSLTMPRVALPDLIGNCSYREAEAKLLAMDFKLTPPKLIDGDKDWVYGIQCDGHNLSAGDLVAKESTLTLIIGNRMPDDELDFEEIDEGAEGGEGLGNGEDDDEIDTFMEMPDME